MNFNLNVFLSYHVDFVIFDMFSAVVAFARSVAFTIQEVNADLFVHWIDARAVDISRLGKLG